MMNVKNFLETLRKNAAAMNIAFYERNGKLYEFALDKTADEVQTTFKEATKKVILWMNYLCVDNLHMPLASYTIGDVASMECFHSFTRNEFRNMDMEKAEKIRSRAEELKYDEMTLKAYADIPDSVLLLAMKDEGNYPYVDEVCQMVWRVYSVIRDYGYYDFTVTDAAIIKKKSPNLDPPVYYYGLVEYDGEITEEDLRLLLYGINCQYGKHIIDIIPVDLACGTMEEYKEHLSADTESSIPEAKKRDDTPKARPKAIKSENGSLLVKLVTIDGHSAFRISKKLDNGTYAAIAEYIESAESEDGYWIRQFEEPRTKPTGDDGAPCALGA